MMFDSRQQAGKLLGEELLRCEISADLVIGLARGGVVVAAEVARILRKPVDAMIVRKIGAPGSPEFAVGAVSEVPGTSILSVWWDGETVRRLGLTDEWKREQFEMKKREVAEYRRQLRGGTSTHNPSGFERSILLVDDGAATGMSMMAAINKLQVTGDKLQARKTKITIALPVASTDAAEKFRELADDVILLEEGSFLSSVGQYYKDFSQVEWEEVRRLLQSFREDHASDH